MMRLQKYDYKVKYERGTNLYLANTLSRAYLPTTIHPTGAEFENINAATFLPVSTSRLREIQQATEDDENLQALKAIILRGWPDDRSQLPEQTTPYFSMRDELSLHDGVIFRGQRIVVPVSLRKDMKQKLHASHLGTESCLRRARETIFWPNMNAELKEMIAACETCRTYETSHHKESLMPHKIPNRPWEQVAVDLFELNKKEYMITVDYYSNFWEIDRLTSTTSSAVVLKLKNHFARYGCPNRFISDNGPQFVLQSFVNSRTIGTLNTERALLGIAKPTVKWNQQWKQQRTCYAKPWVPEQTLTLQFLITAILLHKEWNQVLPNA